MFLKCCHLFHFFGTPRDLYERFFFRKISNFQFLKATFFKPLLPLQSIQFSIFEGQGVCIHRDFLKMYSPSSVIKTLYNWNSVFFVQLLKPKRFEVLSFSTYFGSKFWNLRNGYTHVFFNESIDLIHVQAGQILTHVVLKCLHSSFKSLRDGSFPGLCTFKILKIQKIWQQSFFQTVHICFKSSNQMGLNLPALIPGSFLTQDTWRCRSFNARVYGFIQRKWGNTNAGNERKHNMPRKEKRHVGKNTKPPTLLTNQAGAHGPRKKPRLNQVEKKSRWRTRKISTRNQEYIYKNTMLLPTTSLENTSFPIVF